MADLGDLFFSLGLNDQEFNKKLDDAKKKALAMKAEIEKEQNERIKDVLQQPINEYKEQQKRLRELQKSFKRQQEGEFKEYIQSLSSQSDVSKQMSSYYKELEKSSAKAYQSIEGLNTALEQMKSAYAALNEQQKQSTIGKILGSQITDAETKLAGINSQLKSGIGVTRAAGTQYNMLNAQIGMVARELPNLGISLSTFIISLSNNLPYLADAFAQANKEYNNLKKAGETATPVWKQAVSAIFSWQTALIVGVTLLTAYSREIQAWVQRMFKAKESAKGLYDLQTDINTKMSEGSDAFGDNVVKIKQLQSEWNSLGNSLSARQKFIEDNKLAFDSLGVSVQNVSDAENILVDNTDAFIEALRLRAQATAAQELASEKFKEAFIAAQKGEAEAIKEISLMDVIEAGIGTYNVDKFINNFDKQKQERIKGYKEEEQQALDTANAYFNLGQSKEKEAQATLISAGIHERVKQPKKDIDDYANKVAKINEKQAREQARTEQDLQLMIAQYRIDAMKEGSAKELAQLELNHKKEMIQLKRMREDALQSRIDSERAIFEADKKNKGKIFDSSKIKLSESDYKIYDAAYKALQDKQKREIADYYQDLMAKYQSFNQQRLSLEQKYGSDADALLKKLLNARSDEERKAINESMKSLIKERDKALSGIDVSEIEDSGLWKKLMGDLTTIPTKDLEEMFIQAEEMIKKSVNLSATDIKTLIDTLNKARNELVGRNPFKTLKEEYEKYRKSLKSGDKEGAETAWLNFKLSAESIKSSISSIGDSLSGLGSVFSDELSSGIQKSVSAINDAITAFEVFGKKGGKSTGDTIKGISGIIGAATTLIGGLINWFDDTAKIQERNLEYQRRQEGYWESINYQTERYLKLLQEASGTEYYGATEESLKRLEDARRKSQDIFASMPEGTVDLTTFELDKLIKYGKGFKGLDSSAKKIYDYIQQNGGLEAETGFISEKALLSLKENADIWSRIPSWMQDAIDKYIEINDQAEELNETINQNLFQTTSKSLEDAILQGLKNGKSGISDFGEDFEEVMRNALLQAFVVDELRGKIKEFYEKYTQLADTNGDKQLDLTKQEIEDLRKDWNDIVSDAIKNRDEINNIIGSASSSQQDLLKKGIQGITEQQYDVYIGYLNSVRQDVSAMRQLLIELKNNPSPVANNLALIMADVKRIEANTFRSANNSDVILKAVQSIDDRFRRATTPSTNVKLNL